jgi:polar amino acid transport system substrate-binding protein
MQYKTHADIVVAVKTGRVDAGFYNHETLLELLKKDPELGILKANVERNPIAMGFKKNGELRDRFNTFLQESKTSGVYEDMVKRWMTEGRTDMPAIKNPKNNGRLVVGVVSTKGLPFCTIKDNRLVGFDIELAERFAAYLGKELVLEDMEFSSLIHALEGNKIDMIASTLSITEERKKQIDFSDPYYEMGMTIFALKKNIDTSASNKMSQLDDIADKRVGVATGTIFDGFVAQKYPRAKIFRYQGSADMVVAIKSEKIDVAVIDALTAGLLVENNPELGILTDNVMAIPMGVGFNKNNPALREKFNHYLKEIKASGIYDEIYRRWYVEDPEKAVMPDIKFDSAGPKLVLGVSVADLPYVAVKDGKYVGLDIELIERFAAREGYNLEIITMEFSSLIAALAAGKVDMISDGIAITEERSKQIDFSDCYLEGKSAVIGLKKNMARYEQEPEGSVYKSIIKNIEDSFYNNLIVENRYLLIVGGLKVTAVISVFSVLLGTLLGGLVCFLRMARNRLLSGIARVYISILRGTPVLVLLMIIFYVVFASVNIDPVIVAVIAFGLNFGAYVSEMFRTSIESVDEGQIEAGIASGFTPVQTFIYIVMPQAIRQVLPVYKGEFVSLVKMTSVVGYIAVQDLTKASDIIRSRTFDAFFPLVMVAVLYFLMSWLLALGLDYLGMKTDPKRNRNIGGAKA